MSNKILLRQAAADRLGVHFAKLEALRKRGLVPEAVQVGRYYGFPESQIEAIRARLESQGHIKREVSHAAGK